MTIIRPQIIKTVNVLSSLVSPASQRIAAMIGTSSWGPINTATSLESLSDFVSIFGDETAAGVTGIKGAELFFNNGRNLIFTRVEDGTADYADYMCLNTATQVIQLKGKYKGTYGNNVSILVEAIDTTKRGITISDGKMTEIINNNGAGYATNDDIATAINASSSLITAEVQSGQGTTNLLDAFTITYLTGGADGATSIDSADYTTALDNVLATVDFNFLIIPGTTDNTIQKAILAKMDLREIQNKKYSRYLTGVAVDETIATSIARDSSGKRISILSPSITYINRYTNSTVNLDGSYLACAYAGKLCSLDIELSGTNKSININSLIVNSATGKTSYTNLEQQQLLNGKIIPVSNINGYPTIIRGITRYSDDTSPFIEENIVDITDYIISELETYLDSTKGQPNTEVNRDLFGAKCDSILQSAKNQNIIENFVETEVTKSASPDSYNVTVGIVPSYSVNVIYFTLNVS